MTREEAIAIIENEKECVNRANKNDYCNRDCYNCELVKTDTEILTALDMAIKALEQQPCEDATLKDIFCMGCEYKEQEPKTGHWIAVSERLPEKNVEVLATTEWGAVTIAEMYSANDWFIHEGTTNAETDEIVAWMSLPEPYNAESEAQDAVSN